jgi:hypothetical protein
MNILKLSAVALTVVLLAAAPAFAQSTAATKQKTQEGGTGETPCNLVAHPSSDPDCKNYKQHTQSLVPPVNEDAAQVKK